MAVRRPSRREAAIRFARRLGLTQQEFERVERLHASQDAGGGPDDGAGDVFWALAERQLEAFAAARDWDGISITYYAQARWLFEHEPERDHREFQRLSSVAQVRDIRERGHHRRVAITAHCCEPCDERGGREYGFGEAIRDQILPTRVCEAGWCSCSWIGVPVRR